jgi:hypothetical protein
MGWSPEGICGVDAGSFDSSKSEQSVQPTSSFIRARAEAAKPHAAAAAGHAQLRQWRAHPRAAPMAVGHALPQRCHVGQRQPSTATATARSSNRRWQHRSERAACETGGA